MVEDFIFNPVLACRIIWPDWEFDVFQTAAMKIDWLVPNVMDSSGVNSGKTARRFFYMNLRAMLIPNLNSGHVAAVYFPKFGTGRDTFWKYYDHPSVMSPIFRAQIGRVDSDGEKKGKAVSQQPDCLFCYFRQGSEVRLPAPNFAQNTPGQKSMRFNTQLHEEWGVADSMGTAIDDELIERNTRENWNGEHGEHPIWMNHIKFSAHAETSMHPAAKRYRGFVARVRKGDPNYAHISFSYKDFSNRRRKNGSSFAAIRKSAESALGMAAGNKSDSDRLCTQFGFWTQNGDGFISEEMIDAANAYGRRMKLRPILSAAQFQPA